MLDFRGVHSCLKGLMVWPLRRVMWCRGVQFLEGQQSLTLPHFVPVQGEIFSTPKRLFQFRNIIPTVEV